MDFEEWLHHVDDGDEISVHDGIVDGDYKKSRDLLLLLEEAFEAGVERGLLINLES